MRPAFVAVLFLVIGLVLLGLSWYKAGKPGGPTAIASRVRRRTGTIFVLVAAGLMILDLLT